MTSASEFGNLMYVCMEAITAYDLKIIKIGFRGDYGRLIYPMKTIKVFQHSEGHRFTRTMLDILTTHLANEADLATRCSSGEAVEDDGEDVMEVAPAAADWGE